MSVSSVVAARPGRVSGSTISQKMPKARGTVELRRLFQLDRQTGEEVVHQPHDNRQVRHRIHEDERKCVSSSPTAWNIM